ncbi:sigma-70 family RNA polymerase sigma factor [Sphingobacterium olei]|uniref:Sigma-70 family RNA polymerase sigma factor n=1 Tax=Sphingobacterium olei TaxID=2571155 RepID=A0A4U0P6T1_9SPHI|nr:sigma-70 family RNA polymerase sigma factor [Sphingobacterium olei]TJZ63059.1 sigma-70 family RNA polymerase sigma factor [Sphingobacterium olei]
MDTLRIDVIKRDKEQLDVEQMALDDVSAFNRLYAKYHKPVHANILKLVKCPEQATEVLQDVFLALWQNRFKINPNQPVGGWLFVVSHNKSLNVLRRRLKESIEYMAEYPADLVATEENSREKEEVFQLQMQLLEEAVDILPARKREVFRLCRYEGRSKEDVADLLGISTQSVSDYLKQANKAIKEYVLDRYPGYVSNILLFVTLYF